jgi:hypothetical protein
MLVENYRGVMETIYIAGGCFLIALLLVIILEIIEFIWRKLN